MTERRTGEGPLDIAGHTAGPPDPQARQQESDRLVEEVSCQRVRALFFVYGGTLTVSAPKALGEFCRAEGLDEATFLTLLTDWTANPSPVQQLERGELSIPDFERVFAAELRTVDGRPVQARGLVARLHAKVEVDSTMEALLHRARSAGVHTALLSNSWNFDYDLRDWYQIFDTVVVSGAVGMRKPEPEIYRFAAGLIGVPLEQCVMVDDSPANIEGALAAGMVGLHHRTPTETTDRLLELFGWR